MEYHQVRLQPWPCSHRLVPFSHSQPFLSTASESGSSYPLLLETLSHFYLYSVILQHNIVTAFMLGREPAACALTFASPSTPPCLAMLS